MVKFCRGWFRLLTCRGSVPRRNRTSPASGTSVGWQPTGRLKLGLNAVRPKVQRRRWCRCYLRIRSMSMILTEGVRPAVFSVGAKAGHRQLHRAMLGSDSRFLSPAGSNRRKGTEDAWCRSVHQASSKLVSSPRSLPRQPWCRRSEDPEVLSRRSVRLSLGRRRCKVHRGCKVHRRWLAWRITVKSWPRDS